MAGNEGVIGDERSSPFANPWPTLASGAGAVVLALVLSSFLGESHLWVRFLVAAAGVLAAGIGVAIRPRSPAVLGTAALVALLAGLAVAAGPGPNQAAWGPTSLLFRVMAVVAGCAALLMLLPQVVRRVVVSLLILFHFGGIMTAVTSTPPQPWLTGQLWTYIYRPYLQFLYLNNAYHFYSPEPGPASLVWFRVEYQNEKDGTRHCRWVKEPDIDFETGNLRSWLSRVEFTRRLSLADATNQVEMVPELELQQLLVLRVQAGQEKRIPLNPSEPPGIQYQRPNSFSRFWVATYARHVAQAYPHPKNHPELEVTGVKVYRVIHRILYPHQWAQDTDPCDPITFWPYFQGEFDKDGKLQNPYDPFLYWVIPVMYGADDQAREQNQSPFRLRLPLSVPSQTDARDADPKQAWKYFKRHAGEEDWEDATEP